MWKGHSTSYHRSGFGETHVYTMLSPQHTHTHCSLRISTKPKRMTSIQAMINDYNKEIRGTCDHVSVNEFSLRWYMNLYCIPKKPVRLCIFEWDEERRKRNESDKTWTLTRPLETDGEWQMAIGRMVYMLAEAQWHQRPNDTYVATHGHRYRTRAHSVCLSSHPFKFSLLTISSCCS